MKGAAMIRKPTDKKHPARTRSLAIIAVILLVCLYLATLLAAVFDSSADKGVFKFLLFCSLVFPVLLYVFLMLSRLRK